MTAPDPARQLSPKRELRRKPHARTLFRPEEQPHAEKPGPDKPLTAPQLRALAAIAEAGDKGHTGRSLAQALYPDSPAWGKVTRSRPGFQGSRGGTMPMLGAKIARGLADRGLVYVEYTDLYQPVFTITTAGRRMLDQTAS